MDRREMYKNKGASTEKLRERRRRQSTELRRARRDQAVHAKRMRFSDLNEVVEYSIEQVKEATMKLVKKEGDRLASMKILKTAFSQGSALIDEFLKVDNAMKVLVGILTGTDAELQLEAAWCLTNIAAGIEEHELSVLKHAGPYLVTYLTSSNAALQDQCAWAIGNLAGGGSSHRETLRAQGAVQALINLLQSPHPHVVQQAAFALSNIARDKDHRKELIDMGILGKLSDLLVLREDNRDLVAEVAWVLTYLAASGENEPVILEMGLLDKLVNVLVQASLLPPDSYKVMTPVLRCLGNLCSRPDDAADRACASGKLVTSLRALLGWEHHHVKKEAMWVISNITGSAGVCEQVLSEQLIPPMLSILTTSSFDVKHEVAHCLCNLGSQGREFAQKLLTTGAFPPMISLLQAAEIDNANLALAFTDIMLRNTDEGLRVFEENGGLNRLEALEYHANDLVRERTNEILDAFFYKEGKTP